MSAYGAVIAQISDLHIKPPGELVCGRVDTAAALACCIDTLNRLLPRPDLVVISGDLADAPLPEAYKLLCRLLEKLEIPFVAVPGNHDDRVGLRAALPAQSYARAEGALNSVHAVGGVDVVMVDSSVPGAPYGQLGDATLMWLDATLGASPARPALIFLHHPPFATGICHMDKQNLRNADALAALLRRHPRARLVAAGHVHRAVVAAFAGVTATVCPAPNHAVALDLAGRLCPSFQIEPPAFHLHVWCPGDGFGSIVTHLVPIGAFDGPYPFFATDGRYL